MNQETKKLLLEALQLPPEARAALAGIVMPDAFQEVEEGRTYEAIEIGGDILLASVPLDRERLGKIARLASRSIEEHRKSLEGLAG